MMMRFFAGFLIWVARCGIALARGVNAFCLLILDVAEACLWQQRVYDANLPGSGKSVLAAAAVGDVGKSGVPLAMTCDGGAMDGHVLPFGGVVVLLHDVVSGQVCAYERSAVNRYRFLRVVGRKGGLV